MLYSNKKHSSQYYRETEATVDIIYGKKIKNEKLATDMTKFLLIFNRKPKIFYFRPKISSRPSSASTVVWYTKKRLGIKTRYMINIYLQKRQHHKQKSSVLIFDESRFVVCTI